MQLADILDEWYVVWKRVFLMQSEETAIIIWIVI